MRKPKISMKDFVNIMSRLNGDDPVGHSLKQEEEYTCHLYYNNAGSHIGTWINPSHYFVMHNI